MEYPLQSVKQTWLIVFDNPWLCCRNVSASGRPSKEIRVLNSHGDFACISSLIILLLRQAMVWLRGLSYFHVLYPSLSSSYARQWSDCEGCRISMYCIPHPPPTPGRGWLRGLLYFYAIFGQEQWKLLPAWCSEVLIPVRIISWGLYIFLPAVLLVMEHFINAFLSRLCSWPRVA